ncbi:MAG: exopolysaccharide biosynthesis protein, partial [Solirubrobacterales bacterium]|nr:exopolysaccharide biosynthesis protein [Solirubrobacterales bacterium]
WAQGEGEKTLGSLIEVFEEKSFAVIFVILLGVPALPLPTGGATHVFEVIAMLLSLQLIILLSIGAFVAPAFSGLDTLPALGGVLVSLAVLLEDIAILVVAVVVGAAGVVLEIVLGRAAISGIKQLFSVVSL